MVLIGRYAETNAKLLFRILVRAENAISAQKLYVLLSSILAECVGTDRVGWYCLTAAGYVGKHAERHEP